MNDIKSNNQLSLDKKYYLKLEYNIYTKRVKKREKIG